MGSPTIESIEVHPQTIGLALKNLRLRVPRNQRAYKWETEHVKDLYDDFARAIAEGDTEYFLGSIVVVSKDDGVSEVNDGQQRLATSMILIAAIRDHFLTLNDAKTADLVEAESLVSEDRKTHERTPHLQLSAEDHDYFAARVLSRPDAAERKAARKSPFRASHKRIDRAAGEAAKRVREIVAAAGEKDKSGVLHRWLDFIENGARVIWVEVANERTAYFIFETMNDRGLKLTAADLLKNFILAQADSRSDEAFAKWSAMTAVLDALGDEEDAVVEYIRYLWMTQYGVVRSRDLYDKIKETVKNKTQALTLVSMLEKRAKDYAAVLVSSHEAWATHHQSIRKNIENLLILGAKQIRPLLLSAINKFNKKELAKLFESAVNWSVRLLVVGIPSGTFGDAYARASTKITSGAITTVDGVLGELRSVIPDDKQFLAAAKAANVSNERLARYYLRALQQFADGASRKQYVPNTDVTEVTLEHILPENLEGKWKHINPEIARTYCNKFGNQALLAGSVNSKLGSAEYSIKKPALQQSPFSLTQDAAKFQTWGVAEIESRQSDLAILAVKTWPLKVK
jgi:hypothetical protein